MIFGTIPLALAGVLLWTEWKPNHQFIGTTAVVVDTRVNDKPATGSGDPSYRPEVLVRYSVNNLRFHSWAYADVTTGITGSMSEAAAQASLEAFPRGSTHPCWYDPEHPEHVVLVRGYSWLAYGLLVPAGLAFLAGGLWGMFRSARKKQTGEPGS